MRLEGEIDDDLLGRHHLDGHRLALTPSLAWQGQSNLLPRLGHIKGGSLLAARCLLSRWDQSWQPPSLPTPLVLRRSAAYHLMADSEADRAARAARARKQVSYKTK